MIHERSPSETRQPIHQEDTLAFPIDIEEFVQNIPEDAYSKGHFINQNIEIVQRLNPGALPGFLRLYPKSAPFRDVSLRLVIQCFYDA